MDDSHHHAPETHTQHKPSHHPIGASAVMMIAAMILSLLVLSYFVLPIFLVYPLYHLDQAFPELGVKPVAKIIFYVPIYLSENFEFYKDWLQWQMDLTGVR